MKYRVLHQQRFEYDGFALVPVSIDHMYAIKNWRNAQLDVLRQNTLLTDDQQTHYFNHVIAKLYDQDQPGQIIMSFLLDDELIGYGGLVYINWIDKRAEVSFLLDNVRVADQTLYKKEFSVFLTLIKRLAFVELDFNRIYTETFDIRNFHISILESNGFKLEGVLREHVLINGVYHDSQIHGYLKKYGEF